VLENFSATERAEVPTICEQAADATELLIELGLESAQNRVHACDSRRISIEELSSEHRHLILVSIDDHVVEPPDMFVRHVPANTSTRPPSSPTTTASTNGCPGQAAGVSGLNAVVSWPAEEWGRDPRVRGDAPRRLRRPRARSRT